MIAIAAVDENWGIGYKGELLISLPEDQKGVFRKYTSGHTVVYGRKTLQTLPGERLLPKRTNIILTRNPDFVKDGAVILHSTEELVHYIRNHRKEEIYLIGGAEMYNSFIEICDHAIITSIKASFTADAFFPNLDKDPSWELVEEEPEIMSEKGVAFTVKHYARK